MIEIRTIREMFEVGDALVRGPKVIIRTMDGREIGFNRGLAGNHPNFRSVLAERLGLSDDQTDVVFDGEADLIALFREFDIATLTSRRSADRVKNRRPQRRPFMGIVASA